MLDYKIIPGTALCYLKEGSHINNVPIDYEDFVNKYDHAPDKAQPYACGDMRADVIPPKPEVLEKYKITKADYHTIAFEISQALSFGECGWCV